MRHNKTNKFLHRERDNLSREVEATMDLIEVQYPEYVKNFLMSFTFFPDELGILTEFPKEEIKMMIYLKNVQQS